MADKPQPLMTIVFLFLLPSPKCYSPEELLEVYDAESGVTYSHFMEMCPSLIQLVSSGSCHEEHVPTEPLEPDTLGMFR